MLIYLLMNTNPDVSFRMSFEEDYHVEYGKQFQDKAIGTKNCIANVSTL